MEKPESAHQVDQSVGTAELVQVELVFGQSMQAGLGMRKTVDGIQSGLFDAVRRIRLFDDGPEGGNGARDPIDCVDDDARASNMPTSLVTNLDVDLVAEPQCLDRRVEQSPVGTRVDQRTEVISPEMPAKQSKYAMVMRASY